VFPLDAELADRLHERKAQALYRQRHTKTSDEGPEIDIDGRRYLNFSSNDYLGLANHPKVTDAFQRGVERYGVGSGASHLVTGHTEAHHLLEAELAAFTGRPRALLFSTGYMANLGVVSALAKRGDTVIEDKTNHASLIDGALLSRGQLRRYPHGDVDALARILGQIDQGRSFVLTDGVFSMDGDLAPLPEIASLCRRHRAVLMVDDAHGLGVLGPNGKGSLTHFGLGMADVPILMGTLGKALGVFGAFVAGSEALIETLIQEARSYIYTTALPPAIAEAVRASLKLVQTESWRRETLSELISYFREGARELNLPLMPSETPIQPLILGEATAALKVSAHLREHGLWVVPIRPPTVPEGTARLRISLTAGHTREHIDRLLDALRKIS
jgi:8-amino-7-oxononanoate synthase